MKPDGHVGHGFAEPAGYVLGRNSWSRWLPFVPRYVAVIVREPGRSRWTSACQFCDAPTRRSGSTANVLTVAEGGATKPFASVSGFETLLLIVNAFESGGCCARSEVMGR